MVLMIWIDGTDLVSTNGRMDVSMKVNFNLTNVTDVGTCFLHAYQNVSVVNVFP
jgi:hypothetical protein